MKNKSTLTLAALAVLIAITISSADAIAAAIDESDCIPAPTSASLFRINSLTIAGINKNIYDSISVDRIGGNVVADAYIEKADIKIAEIAVIGTYAVEGLNIVERGITI
jgi:hypothetical protein